MVKLARRGDVGASLRLVVDGEKTPSPSRTKYLVRLAERRVQVLEVRLARNHRELERLHREREEVRTGSHGGVTDTDQEE